MWGVLDTPADAQRLSASRQGAPFTRVTPQTLDIRRDSLHLLLRGGSKVPVQRVRLVYERGALLPEDVNLLKTAVRETESKVPGVEVLFQ